MTSSVPTPEKVAVPLDFNASAGELHAALSARADENIAQQAAESEEIDNLLGQMLDNGFLRTETLDGLQRRLLRLALPRAGFVEKDAGAMLGMSPRVTSYAMQATGLRVLLDTEGTALYAAKKAAHAARKAGAPRDPAHEGS